MSASSQEYFDRLDSLFHEALRAPTDSDREALLETSCGSDTALRDEVRRLLAADRAVREMPAAASTMPRFGVYQAREMIGRGGMGAVYLATREDGEISLRVAVKVISSPLWSPLLEERFRRERQILAQLRHPGIAAFLDGGVSAEGLPFLVMEYVEGEPIDRYCERRHVPLRQRLELFLAVCGAVAAAHRQLVVHRDIKPGNVLVTAAGAVKLLDFGLARTMEAAGSTDDHPTLFLTPLYSSPEVLRGRPAAVTDDVYSLGVLLYELLAGRKPFGDAAAPAEVIEAVLNQEPRRPSELAGRAAGRALQGDLDAIALCAVAKQASGRYQAVAELANDVQRFLQGRAVTARAGGRVYRTRKWVGRHKTFAVAALLLLAAVAGGTATTWLEAREAQRQRAAAERRFQEARELARYMMFELQTSIQKLPGATPIKADMVRHSLAYLDRIAAEKSNDDALRLDIAQGYTELADVLGHPLRPNLGEAAEARAIYGKAIATLRPVTARDPRNLAARRALARAQLMLGMSLTFYRQWEQGRKLVETSARELDRLAQLRPADFEILKQAAAAQESLAVTSSQRDGYTMGGDQAGVDSLSRAIRYGEAAVSLKPGDAEAVGQLASSYNRLALLTQTRDRTAAAAYFTKALAMLDALPAAEREAAGMRSRRASMLLASGWNLGSAGDFARGIAQIHQARDIMERLAAEDPQNRVYPQARASIYRNLGVIEDYAGDRREALAAYLTSISIYRQMLSGGAQNPYYRTSLADLQANAALLSAKLGRRSAARELALAGVPVLKETARKPDASAAELNLAARFLTAPELPEVCEGKAGLALAQRANKAAAGKDYVVLETLAQAYWMNRDRQHAIQSTEQAMALLQGPPARVRGVFEKELADYRRSALPAGCK